MAAMTSTGCITVICRIRISARRRGPSTYVVPLVKNTNNVRVVLQQTSGAPLDEKRSSFRITAENGAWTGTTSCCRTNP